MGRIIDTIAAAWVVLMFAAIVYGVLLLLAGCLLVGCAAAGRDQGVSLHDDTTSTARLASTVETVAGDVAELRNEIRTINTTIGANSGDNWTTRIERVVLGLGAAGWIILDRRRFHRKKSCCAEKPC